MVSVDRGERLLTNFFRSQLALFELINSFILEPVYIGEAMGKIIEFVKTDSIEFLLPPQQGKGRSWKKWSEADWETFFLIWTKDPYIMQNTKNRETDAKAITILDSGTIPGFILVLSWHQSLDKFMSLSFSFLYFIPYIIYSY